MTALAILSSQSPRCGSSSGSVPKTGLCVTDDQVDDIQSWLTDGAQLN